MPAGAQSGTDDGTPDSGHVLGGRRSGDRPATAPRQETAHPQAPHSGGGDGGVTSVPRYAAPPGTRCPRPDGADRVPRSGGSRPRPERGGYRAPAGFGARVGSGDVGG